MRRLHGRLNRQVQVARCTSTSATKNDTKATAPVKAQHTIDEIARLKGRHRRIIIREPERGYRAKHPCRKASDCAQHSRNTRRLAPKVWAKVDLYLGVQRSPEQIASQVKVIHASVSCLSMPTKPSAASCTDTYAAQKPRSKLHLSWDDRCGKILAATPPASDLPMLNSASRWA